MSVYDDEGILQSKNLGRRIEADTGLVWNINDGVLVLKETGSGASPVICKIQDSSCQFQVEIRSGDETRHAMAYRFILAYVIQLRDKAIAQVPKNERTFHQKITTWLNAHLSDPDEPKPSLEQRIASLESDHAELLDELWMVFESRESIDQAAAKRRFAGWLRDQTNPDDRVLGKEDDFPLTPGKTKVSGFPCVNTGYFDDFLRDAARLKEDAAQHAAGDEEDDR